MTDPDRRHGVDGGRGGDEIAGRLDGPVIFVVGAARSGTTWVFDLFNSHPFVHAVFESGLFDPNLGLAGLLAAAPNRWDLSRKRHLVPREALLAEVRGSRSGCWATTSSPTTAISSTRRPDTCTRCC